MNASEQTVECRVAGLLGEDRVKARLQFALACEGGTPLVLLEVRVQRPDPAAHTCNILTVLIIQRQQLVNQALRVHPTYAVNQDIELSCVIADDGEILGHAAPLQATQQRALGGDVAVASNVHAQAVEVEWRGALIGKACAVVLTQRIQEHPREPLLFHVSERVFVDLVSMSRPEQLEEIDAALRARALPRESAPCPLAAARSAARTRSQCPIRAIAHTTAAASRGSGGAGTAHS